MVTSETCGDVSPSHGDKAGKVFTKDINECIAGWLGYLQVEIDFHNNFSSLLCDFSQFLSVLMFAFLIA